MLLQAGEGLRPCGAAPQPVRVSGLKPGRLRVNSELGLDQVLNLDGTKGIHLTLDLRR